MEAVINVVTAIALYFMGVAERSSEMFFMILEGFTKKPLLFQFFIGFFAGMLLAAAGFYLMEKIIRMFNFKDPSFFRFGMPMFIVSIPILWGLYDIGLIGDLHVPRTVIIAQMVGSFMMGYGMVRAACPAMAAVQLGGGDLSALASIGGMIFGKFIAVVSYPIWNALFYWGDLGQITWTGYLGGPWYLHWPFIIFFIVIAGIFMDIGFTIWGWMAWWFQKLTEYLFDWSENDTHAKVERSLKSFFSLFKDKVKCHVISSCFNGKRKPKEKREESMEELIEYWGTKKSAQAYVEVKKVYDNPKLLTNTVVEKVQAKHEEEKRLAKEGIEHIKKDAEDKITNMTEKVTMVFLKKKEKAEVEKNKVTSRIKELTKKLKKEEREAENKKVKEEFLKVQEENLAVKKRKLYAEIKEISAEA